MNTKIQSFRARIKIPALILAVLALLAITLTTPPAQAADYAIQKTFWSAGATLTNITGTATNLDAAIDVTQFTEFTLEVQTGLTNAATGTIDIRWTTSNDGSKYSASPAAPGAAGWFSVPLTNAGTDATWRTNITVGAYGYWKIAWVTNVAAQHQTNALIRGYVKPKNSTWR